MYYMNYLYISLFYTNLPPSLLVSRRRERRVCCYDSFDIIPELNCTLEGEYIVDHHCKTSPPFQTLMGREIIMSFKFSKTGVHLSKQQLQRLVC